MPNIVRMIAEKRRGKSKSKKSFIFIRLYFYTFISLYCLLPRLFTPRLVKNQTLEAERGNRLLIGLTGEYTLEND